jgi:hypothetical protein
LLEGTVFKDLDAVDNNFSAHKDKASFFGLNLATVIGVVGLDRELYSSEDLLLASLQLFAPSDKKTHSSTTLGTTITG